MAKADIPQRRWGEKTRLDDDTAARERLLDAAEACFERVGLSETTIEDVAREAKVSRSTVYRYFDGRDDLIAAAYLRESEAIIFEKVQTLMSRPGTFAERVIEATLRSIDAMRTGRYLPLMFSPEGIPLSSQAITASREFHQRAKATMTPFFEAAKERGEVPADMRIDDFVEWHVRVIFSFAMLDSPMARGKERSRRLIATFVGPALSPK